MSTMWESLFGPKDRKEMETLSRTVAQQYPEKITPEILNTWYGTPQTTQAPVTTSGSNWYDLGFGSRTGGGTFMPSAPSVSAPYVKAPTMPEPKTAIPNYYGAQMPKEPVSELTSLIEQITGRNLTPAPTPRVDDDYINSLLQQYGITPKTPEEIQAHAQAIVDRQKYSQEQILMREIDRFERDYPNEFRQVETMLRTAAENYSADKQEEMAARGLFYSSIMANGIASVDREVVQILGDIARDAANRVADLRGDVRDLAQWAVLEQEVIMRALEEQESQKRTQLMFMHLEVATWADQMALDAWYKEETLTLQQEQLKLQGIQLKMQEAERMGQHLATAFMADHPLVQESLINMGITPEQFAGMPLEQQSYMVTSVVNFNDIQQQMQMRELQMRAIIAEIQLQNAALQLQASIANAQFSMEAQKMSLQHLMHMNQMDLAWSQHGLDVTMANWQMSQPRYAGTAATQAEGLNWDSYNYALGMIQQGMPGSMVNTYISTLDPITAAAVRKDQNIFKEPTTTQTTEKWYQKDLDYLMYFLNPFRDMSKPPN